MKLKEWLDSAVIALAKAGVDSARLDSLLLLEQELSKPRTWLLAHHDFELPNQAVLNLNNKVAQRANRVPVAYLLGSKEFYGREFSVTPEVLIPRPESEAMITLLKNLAEPHLINTVLDVGTGSGILAITAKLELPGTHVSASDISEKALLVARANAEHYNASICFHQSNLFEGLPKLPRTRPYVVLANLPYVPEHLITSPEITKEPAEALFAGDDGMDIYKLFWQQIGNLKNKPFAIITESLTTQHATMVALSEAAGYQCAKTDGLIQLFEC